MTEQYRPNIGCIPEPNAMRDAVHIAVAPVTAGTTLEPGERIELHDDGMVYLSQGRTSCIGIVDPFLDQLVYPGQKVWIFLLPYTITNLRHVWSHPAFQAKPHKVVNNE